MKRFLAWALVLPFVLYNLTFVIFPLFTVLYQSLFTIDAEYNVSHQASLANFKIPKRCFVVAELPRNTMGKVQKNLLRNQYADLFAA